MDQQRRVCLHESRLPSARLLLVALLSHPATLTRRVPRFVQVFADQLSLASISSCRRRQQRETPSEYSGCRCRLHSRTEHMATAHCTSAFVIKPCCITCQEVFIVELQFTAVGLSIWPHCTVNPNARTSGGTASSATPPAAACHDGIAIM